MPVTARSWMPMAKQVIQVPQLLEPFEVAYSLAAQNMFEKFGSIEMPL